VGSEGRRQNAAQADAPEGLEAHLIQLVPELILQSTGVVPVQDGAALDVKGQFGVAAFLLIVVCENALFVLAVRVS
jgi:hypothetical protein